MVKIINPAGDTVLYHPQKKREKTFEEKNPGYNPEVEWYWLLVRLLRENKSYTPPWAGEIGHGRYLSYIMDERLKGRLDNNKTCYCYYRDDFRAIHDKKEKKETAYEEACIHFGIKQPDLGPKTVKWFVTFNWAPDCSNFDQKHIVDVGIPALFTKSYVVDARGVFEFHSSEGKGKNHPHFMCIIECTIDNKTKYLKSFKQKMTEATISRDLADNYVDIIKYAPRHDPYVDLDKCEEKQEALAKDVVWRQERLLKEEYHRDDYVKSSKDKYAFL